MPKPKLIKRKLGTIIYDYYKCVVCNDSAKYSSGIKSEDGIGYDMNCYCEQHQKEFEERYKGSQS